MNTQHERRIDPTEISPEMLRQIEELFHDPGRPVLVRPDGQRVELPDALNDLLVYVVETMKRNQALLLLPEDQTFTTQTAARFLGMSRPYLLRLLEAGKIPFHFVGTHRRILFKDLRAFQQERDRARREKLDALTRTMDEAGVYDRC